MDDSRLQFGYQSCSLVLVVHCRSIKKYPILARLQTLSLGQTNFMIVESSSVLCWNAYKK